jgi:hypothetical protein
MFTVVVTFATSCELCGFCKVLCKCFFLFVMYVHLLEINLSMFFFVFSLLQIKTSLEIRLKLIFFKLFYATPGTSLYN